MSWGLLLYFVNDFFGFGKNKKNLTRNRWTRKTNFAMIIWTGRPWNCRRTNRWNCNLQYDRIWRMSYLKGGKSSMPNKKAIFVSCFIVDYTLFPAKQRKKPSWLDGKPLAAPVLIRFVPLLWVSSTRETGYKSRWQSYKNGKVQSNHCRWKIKFSIPLYHY
jgi:hypothetical protein